MNDRETADFFISQDIHCPWILDEILKSDIYKKSVYESEEQKLYEAKRLTISISTKYYISGTIGG
jgi:hypothetical protein